MESQDTGSGLQEESPERQQHVQLRAHGVPHQRDQRDGPRAPGPAPHHPPGARGPQRTPQPPGVRQERLRLRELHPVLGPREPPAGETHPGGGGGAGDRHVTSGRALVLCVEGLAGPLFPQDSLTVGLVGPSQMLETQRTN